MAEVWPAHMPRSLEYPEAGLDALVEAAARLYPERTALVDGEQSLSYAAFADLVHRVAGGLRERGIGPGDIVALHMPNSLWYPISYYAVVTCGAAAAPLNPAQPPAALAVQLRELGATAAVTHASCFPALAAAGTTGLRLMVCAPATAAAPADGTPPTTLTGLEQLAAAAPLSGPPVSPDALAHLQLTGGTTGRAKGVRVLHRNLLAHVLQQSAWRTGHLPRTDAAGRLRLEPAATGLDTFPLRPCGGVVVTVAPMFHGLALVSHAMNILTGVTVVLPGRFQAHDYLAAVERHRATYVVGAPAFYHALLRAAGESSYDLGSVRATYSGGAPLDTTALERLRQVFPHAVVGEGYGLSEATGSLVSTLLDQPEENPRGSVGLPVFDTEIQIRSADGDRVLPAGEIGEIWARGPQIADGYHGAPELTEQQFREGWLHTGDLGRLDDRGFLFLAGRSKDMLIYKGYNVYAQHLEEVLAAHPDVAQVSVVGAPREGVGEIPFAFVVLREGAVACPGDLMDFVAARVAPYQRIRELRTVPALPLSATGKVLKTELRALVAAAG
ncbi:class I adenylate-forming enzyme family protein [Streptomyces sp. NPDC048527]|uniref:class I adenylate-forming enzyme family protein n=1 Tax=Streptomyces sp. NPDC048527 TaxID=3365568 RepID=UPI003722B3EF